MKQTIQFKSDTPNYYKERDGVKANTVRTFDKYDPRYDIVTDMIRSKEWGKIEIIHAQLPTEKFTRQLTDITTWRGLYVFSWRHEEDDR